MTSILETRIFSFQHNGQFLFVSNEFSGADRIVEAHPFADEARNNFDLFPADPAVINVLLIKHRATSTFLFVSNDKAGSDNIVEAHTNSSEARNKWIIEDQGDGLSAFFNPATGTFMFLSNDQRDDDYVIEAHPPAEVRNGFIFKPGAPE